MGSLIGAMMTGGASPTRERQKDDFYPTPPDVTEALLDNWPLPPGSVIWEPACGDGAISRVLKARGHVVLSSDLHDHGCKTEFLDIGVDFLTWPGPFRYFWAGKNPCDHIARYIITNPPFKLAAEFIDHACSMELDGVAMLLKSQFWHARCRTPLFHKHRPAMVLPLTWRPDFLKQGGPTMDVMWCVWIKGWGLPPLYRPILRPEGFVQAERKARKKAREMEVA